MGQGAAAARRVHEWVREGRALQKGPGEARFPPASPPGAWQRVDVLAENLSCDEFSARSEASDERRDVYRRYLFEYTRKQEEYADMITKLQRLARDCDSAISAWEAADALYEQRKATLLAELKAAELQAAMTEMMLQRCRERTRTTLLADAEKQWGPGCCVRHHSNPTHVVYTCVYTRGLCIHTVDIYTV